MRGNDVFVPEKKKEYVAGATRRCIEVEMPVCEKCGVIEHRVLVDVASLIVQ